jgi:geranylgeranyl diphosphate synthase type I
MPGPRRIPHARTGVDLVATGYRGLARLLSNRYHAREMTTAQPVLDAAALIADTEAEILRVVSDRDPSTAGVYEMVRYHLGLDGSGASAGKRMRPLLGLLAYASIAGDYRPALPGAAAVELGHNFSLVHDDIEDGDRERRHRPTVWALHGVAQAINTGDMLFSLSRVALHRLSDLGFSDAKVLRLMRLFDETCVALCEGQYIDIATSENDALMSVELYFDMIGRKTAALIAASIEAGALLATDDDEVIARYRGFGWALGLAFQINDDLLGIWGAEQATGKEPSDIARRKKTLPVIYAFEHAGPEDHERLAALYGNGGPTGDDVAEIIAILERSGARDYTRDQARRHRDEALAELDAAGVVDPEARARLEEIIVSVIAA